MTLVLASASPRRKELLVRVGVPIEVRPADIDERTRAGEAALPYVARLAAGKAEAVAHLLRADGDRRWVLGADTIVEIDGDILGKAANEQQATAMLERLVGRVHRVSTAFALRGPDADHHDQVVTTEVVMRSASADEIAAYVAAGEWRGKAGAYAVQGMAAALVAEVRGSITNVIGLPLAEVVQALQQLGIGGARYRDGIPA